MKNRIIVKHETAENWRKAKNFVPLDGEICVYEYENESPKIKIGNGRDIIEDLPFVGENNSKHSVVEEGILNLM